MHDQDQTFQGGIDFQKEANPFAVDKKEVGLRIRELREGKNLTQAELARRVGRSRPAIAQWEEGVASPDLGFIAALAFHLGATPQYIAFGVVQTCDDSFRIPLIDFASPGNRRVGEMSIDMGFHRDLHLPANARLRAYRLKQDGELKGAGRGSVIVIDEMDRTLVGAGEAVLILDKVPRVAYVTIVPGEENLFNINFGGRQIRTDGGLLIIGRVVAVLSSLL